MRNPRTGAYTRCRMHGGASTGPRTAAGQERCRRANWKHGAFSAGTKAARRQLRARLRNLRIETAQLARDLKMYLRLKKLQPNEPTPTLVGWNSAKPGTP